MKTNAHHNLWRDLSLDELTQELDEVRRVALTEGKPWLYHEYDDTIHYLKLRILEEELGIQIDESLRHQEHRLQ